MARAWRRQPGTLLIIFMVLDVLTAVYERTAGASLTAGQPITGQLMWLALDGFLTWRIWRHGRVAWAALFVLNALTLLVVEITVAVPWPQGLLGAMVVVGAQIILLVSPAIRDHVRARPTGRGSRDGNPSAARPTETP